MTVNQQTVEETKKQIRVLVNEIAALGKSGVPAEEYYPQFLQRVVTALAAVGGAIWLLDDDRNVRLQYQINMADSLLDEQGDDAMRHRRLVRRVASANQSLLVPPYSGTTDGEAEGNPSRYLLVLTPLSHDKKVDGLIEVFQRPEAAPATQQGYLRFLQQMAELGGEWIKNERLAHFSDRQVLWQQADTFARLSHESLDLKETAYIVANEGRRLIGCDRVSVAIKKGRKCKVQAVSGQDTIENRSNIIAALNNLATRVVAAGEPLWHDGSTEDLPPQIEDALEDYVDQSYGRHIAVLPLREPERKLGTDKESGAAGEIDRDGSHRGEVIGALIVEQIESDIPPEIFKARCDLVYEHGTRAIANSLAHTNLFLMPVWRALGRATWVLKARTLPKTLAVVGAIAALILAGIFVPMDFDLEAEGTLLPQVRREVFANIDGEVIDVLVKENDVVEEGQVLVKLRNPEVDIELADLQGEIQTKNAEISRLDAQMKDRRSMERSEQTALEVEKYKLQTEMRILTEKLAMKRARAADLDIKAPISGTVVSWEVDKTLRARPVSTGQVLMEIADLTKPKYLELRMPEKREGHLDEFIRKENASELKVEYILASDPDVTLDAVLPVDNISLRAEADEENGAIIKMKAVPDQVSLGDLNPSPGTRFTADVKCGRAASGFVLLHEVYEWAYKFFF